MALRIVIASNGLNCVTGYACQVKKMVRVYQELGHEVAIQAFYGIQGGMLTIEGVPHYCGLRDLWGQDVIGQTVKHFGADLVQSVHDLWVLGPGYQQKAGVPFAPYFPVDSVPANPATVERAREARFPIVYSKFGLEEMAKAGVKCDYIPHLIDTSIFKPGDKKAACEHLGLPTDRFVVSMCAANRGYPSRKAFPEQLSAFAEFHVKRPDSILFLHTQKSPVGHYSDGIYFDNLLKDLGLADKGCVYFSNEYLSAQGLFTEEDVAKVYQASDVLMSASYAEGFGLPILEAQACGTPVITTNFSSMPELTFHGVCTEPASREWLLLGCWQSKPDPSAVLDALECVYKGQIDKKSPDFCNALVEGLYGHEAIKPQWKALLDRIEEEVTELKSFNTAAD